MTRTAVLLDGIVEGVRYDAGNGVTGTTDEHGVFEYIDGQPVSFYLGNLFLGSAYPVDSPAGLTGLLADKVVTPLGLANSSSLDDPGVLNRVRLLMMLDKDGDPANGIQIEPVVVNALAGVSAPDFNAAVFAPLEIIQAAERVTGRNLSLVDSHVAKSHLCDSLARTDCDSDDPSSTNHVPAISGTPAISVNVGGTYSFTPTSSDADGDTLTFSIQNVPLWAGFSISSGKLSGMPTAADVGTTNGIIISVTDGKSSPISLPAFNLTVVQPNRVPTISGTPATSVNVGEAYSFTPTAGDADGDTLLFSIEHQPAWADFESSSGKLSGTPTADDIGTTDGIVIRVTDGKSDPVALGVFSLEVVGTIVDPLLTMDSDGDTIPDITDPDDDDDDVPDNDDYRPLDGNITVAPTYTGQINAYAQTYVRLDNPAANYNDKSFIQIRDMSNPVYATAGLLYFNIPAVLEGKRVDNITQARLTVKSDDEKDTLRVYASAVPAFPEAAQATWENTSALFGNTLYGSMAMMPATPASTTLAQPVTTGKLVLIVDETGNDSREKLVKDNNEIYLDLEFQEVDPVMVNVIPVVGSRATLTGGELKYEVTLVKAPTNDVLVPLQLTDTTTASITSGATLRFTPTNYNIPQTVVIVGKDDGSNSGTQDNQLQIYPLHSEDNAYNGVNPLDLDFKVYATLPDAPSGEAYSYQANFSAADATFSLENAPVGMNINAKTGVITWQPDRSEVGSYDFAIIAKQGDAVVYNKAVNLTVKLAGSNPTDAFYVAPAGTAADPGAALGSIANPFTTIEAALSAAANSADTRTVYVRGGRYDDIAVNVDGIHGSKEKQIVLTRLPGERVKFTFSGLSAFYIAENASYIVFDGFEVDGQSVQDHWDMLANHWWDPLGDRNIGGGQAFNVDGQHITIRNNVIHDAYQKGVNIYAGRYVNVLDNVVYNIGHSSLSGGHGIMRKWPRNFGVDTYDSPDYQYRYDVTGNMVLGVEQRIYSRVFNKGYSNLTIDEGKPILFDETDDTAQTSRISHNLVLYGGVDHIRLKQNANMEVHNNSILTDLVRTDTTPDGITDKNKLPNLKFYGNLVTSKGMAIDVDDSFASVDAGEDPIADRKYDNFIAGGGNFSGGLGDGVTDKGGDASALFADAANNDFHAVATGTRASVVGVDDAHLQHIFDLVNDYGIEVKPGGWQHDHLKNAEYIIGNVPNTVFDTSTFYIGPSTIEEGHQAVYLKFIDTDGKWLYTKLEEEGGNWNSLSNPDLTDTKIFDLPNVDIQKCDVCTGAYTYQLVLPHEWFDHYGNDSNTPFDVTTPDNKTLHFVYLDPVTNPEHRNILDYAVEGKVTSYELPQTETTALNLAKEFGVASQGGTYGGLGAELAIDDNLTSYNHTSCNATDNWWQVSLPDTSVSRIVVTGRSDWVSRLTGAEVYLMSAPYGGTLSESDKVFTLAGTAAAQEIVLPTARSATYLVIKAAGSNCLHMQNVEVYGAVASAPQFQPTAYQFPLDEHAVPGTIVGQLRAVDYQLDTLSYTLEGFAPFSIDAQGNITLTGALDHNRVSSYSFNVIASDGSHSSSTPVTVSLGSGKGVYLQRWEGISGTAVSDLLQSAHYQNDAPDYTASLGSFDVTDSGKSSFGQKLSGVIVPAVSGNYQFAIIGDDGTRLSLAGNVLSDSAVIIAEKTGWGGYQDWANAGKSALVPLEAGKAYYLEALHKEGSGGDHVSVGWKREGDASFSLISADLLYQDAMSAGFVKPDFVGGKNSYLIPWTTAVDTLVATAHAADPQGDSLTYKVEGDVPFRVDGSGDIRVNNTLLAGKTYTFDVRVSDGVHTITKTLNIVTTSDTAVEDALQSGEVSNVTSGELLDATIAELASQKSGKLLLAQLYDTDYVAYAPGNNSQLLDLKAWVDSAYPILTGTKGNVLGMAGSTAAARYAAFGSVPTNQFQAGSSLQLGTPFQRLLAWLMSGDTDLAGLDDSRTIALSMSSSSSRNNFKAWLAGKAPNWSVQDCNTISTLTDCYSNVDLIVSNGGNSADAAVIHEALQSAMTQGKPVLYLHTGGWGANDASLAIADLLNFSLPYGGNYWADDAADWADSAAMQTAVWEQQGLGGVEKMLNHFKAEDYAFNWSACVDENCSAVAGLDSEFQQGANKVRNFMNQLDFYKVNLFRSGESRLLRLLALLGDSYRQSVRFPMDKVQTDDTAFMKAYFADHAVYNYRLVNPVQPDMGNFSRSDFSHITPVSKTVDLQSKVNFRSAGVYALPGQTVRVTRLDNSNLTVKVFVNTQRSGSTHQWAANGYSRPKYLQSPQMEVKSGETIAFTSPYGGPIQVAFSTNDLPVQLRFENVGEHPYWRSSADDTSFTAKLAAGDYDWAELVTPGFEVHSTLGKMRESVSNWSDAANLAAKTMRHLHNFPHVLAGFQGPGIDVVPEIHAFAAAKGLTIETLDMVKHMNADQATCGYGCSGNPYDAYWAFDAIGHGDIHELGHGLEKSRFRFSGWEGHSTTNPYSYYSKTQYYKDTGNDPVCQSLPFESVFNTLQASVGQVDPMTYLQTNLWATSDWSHQVNMTIEMMMAAQYQGALQDGWHLLARLHILEREFSKAKSSETNWAAKKDSLGFSGYTLAEAQAVSNNDWLVVSISWATGLDYRDYIRMWGQDFSAKADAQVAGFGYPVVQRRFFISSPQGYCKGTGFDGVNLPVDGSQAWPN